MKDKVRDWKIRILCGVIIACGLVGPFCLARMTGRVSGEANSTENKLSVATTGGSVTELSGYRADWYRGTISEFVEPTDTTLGMLTFEDGTVLRFTSCKATHFRIGKPVLVRFDPGTDYELTPEQKKEGGWIIFNESPRILSIEEVPIGVTK